MMPLENSKHVVNLFNHVCNCWIFVTNVHLCMSPGDGLLVCSYTWLAFPLSEFCQRAHYSHSFPLFAFLFSQFFSQSTTYIRRTLLKVTTTETAFSSACTQLAKSWIFVQFGRTYALWFEWCHFTYCIYEWVLYTFYCCPYDYRIFAIIRRTYINF